MFKSLYIAAALWLGCAPLAARAAPLDVAKATEIAAATEKKWGELNLKGDIDALLPMYTDDVVFFGSQPGMYLGHEGVRQYLSTVNMGAARGITFIDRQVRVLAPNVFTTSSFVLFDLELDGKPVRWRYGITWTMIKQGADWKIALHHASPREKK